MTKRNFHHQMQSLQVFRNPKKTVKSKKQPKNQAIKMRE